MASNEVTLDIEKIMPEVKMIITIKESYRFRFKKWIAIKLMILAAHILGCGGFEIAK